MPLIQGVGDEVVYAAVVAAAPIVLIWRSAFRGPFSLVKRGATAVTRLLGSIWGHVRGRGSQLVETREVVDVGLPAGNNADSAEGSLAAQLQQVQQQIQHSIQRSDLPPESEICSVCHDSFTLPVQANCSHWFCGECILRVWQHSVPLAPCRCPICRRHITLLIPSDAASARPAGQVADRILRDVAKYNRTFGGGPVSFWQRVRDMPMLLRRMAYELADPQRAMRLLHNARILFCLVLVVLYVLSPLDIISESVVGVLGLLDDALLLLCVGFYLSILYRATLLLHHGRTAAGDDSD